MSGRYGLRQTLLKMVRDAVELPDTLFRRPTTMIVVGVGAFVLFIGETAGTAQELPSGTIEVSDRAVMERAHQKHRQRREPLAVGAGTHIGRDRHLAYVELKPAHHAAERIDQHRHLDKIEGETFGLYGAVPEGLVVALGAGDRGELWLGHG